VSVYSCNDPTLVNLIHKLKTGSLDIIKVGLILEIFSIWEHMSCTTGDLQVKKVEELVKNVHFLKINQTGNITRNVI